MKHLETPQFFLTVEAPCPYLEGEQERKVFASLSGADAQQIQNKLSDIGFRRSQNIIYRPACASCAACISARIPVSSFEATKNQARIMRKNRDIAREVRNCIATEEQYEIFSRYVTTRHKDGGMADMTLNDYALMINETDVSSRLIEYRLIENDRPGRLIAVALTDIVQDGISMVYSFFDPDYSARSLGRYMILDHVEICKSARLAYVYLGYWVKGSPSMAYKSQFTPIELFLNDQWTRFADAENAPPPRHLNAQELLLRAHRKLFYFDDKDR